MRTTSFDKRIILLLLASFFILFHLSAQTKSPRDKILINDGWRFFKYTTLSEADSLRYDVRPMVKDERDDKPADSRPTEAVKLERAGGVLKPWIMPTGNPFVKDPKKRHIRPPGNPGADFPFVQTNFDDSKWEQVQLPHDWAIRGPFQQGWNSEVGGGMGRLPSHGVAWYRKELDIPSSDDGKSIYLDVDGAMSYAMVWINGKLAGGWPYGYNSFRVNLTPYLVPGSSNQLAIRIDNPPSSSRWYPGGGLYRNVWLTKTSPVHVSHWGTFVKPREISKNSAVIDLDVTLENTYRSVADVEVNTKIYALNLKGERAPRPVANYKPLKLSLGSGRTLTTSGSVTINNPKLWGPLPEQNPNRYAAVTTVSMNGKIIDSYETIFGIRELRFDAKKGVFVNGQRIELKGVNQHHDLGSLGAAFNKRAAERQLELLREMGCNAIRMAHNPPAPELLALTDSMGFLVVNEIYDGWELKKTPLDFHLIFPDWHEQDLRAFIRRDRNHPSIIMWSFGNEVGEQYTGEQGAELARRLNTIVKEEDMSRPTTLSMNYAKAHMPLPGVADIISLNYQGEGIRNGAAYAGLKGINTQPVFPEFHSQYPDKVIVSSENAATLSSRGEYMFPIFKGNSSPVRGGQGGDSLRLQVSAYEIYTVDFGASPDKVFATMDKHPFVAGGFVWSGWDYLGEPSPYYLARSSYFGIIDLAGFKKDRFYLYQSRWKPEMPMAHILPHWNWPDRVGLTTPVHVFTSGDEAELFLNGKSQGRKKMARYEYRFRWDEVRYAPGELKVVSYKDGKKWAEETIKTTGGASQLQLSADRQSILCDGSDLSFITLQVTDKAGLMVPTANDNIRFSIQGPGEIVATDNGDPANFVSFLSHERKTFNGLCLVIVRGKKGQPGLLTITAESDTLKAHTITINSRQ
ncbi:beta-galactosidase [Arcticibacter pallidicorallinus]|uniref:Beta-galactosidase n=1 Tax=Arcticibacter pallidicorallinus TaxID=1259464 RepID=A0A2T0U4F1_9SPHI|nr:beta-galactosidase GalB [Arcticibacter pallidicorallinus]PRY52803.1 beta-galactosidase [Arcticibacter pallidicorallinus]